MLPNDSTHADESLVEKSLSGNFDAFGALVAKYRSLVFGVCYNMTNNPVDAEDLSQEAFLSAFTQLHALRDPPKFGNWLYQITHNACRMWHRRRKIENAAMGSLTESMKVAHQGRGFEGCIGLGGKVFSAGKRAWCCGDKGNRARGFLGR